MGTRNSLSAPVADHLSRNLNTRCIQRKFVLKGFTNNYLFTKPLITVLMKDDLSSCLVQDNGGDLGAAGWSWGTVAFSLVAPSWEIPSHSWASAEAVVLNFHVAMMQVDFMSPFLLCTIGRNSKSLQPETAELGQLPPPFLNGLSF